jgi:hypothetical protein
MDTIFANVTAISSRADGDDDRHDIIMESSSPAGSPSILPHGDTLIENMTGCQLDDEIDLSEVLHEVQDIGPEEYRGLQPRADAGQRGAMSLMFHPYARQLRQDADSTTIDY